MGAYPGQSRPSSLPGWIKFMLLGLFLSVLIQVAATEGEPTESECRPYIEKALKEHHIEEDEKNPDLHLEQVGNPPTDEINDSTEGSNPKDDKSEENNVDADTSDVKTEDDEDNDKTEEQDVETEEDSNDVDEKEKIDEDDESLEKEGLEVDSKEHVDDQEEKEDTTNENDSVENNNTIDASGNVEDDNDDTLERISVEIQEVQIEEEIKHETDQTPENQGDDDEKTDTDDSSKENEGQEEENNTEEANDDQEEHENKVDDIGEKSKEQNDGNETNEDDSEETKEDKSDISDDKNERAATKSEAAESEEAENKADTVEQEEAPEEEELIKEVVIPENLRPREHINKILKLDEDSGMEKILEKAIDTTLKALKSLYDNAIKPLEMLYKYRDLSNRHFGDPEIFSKPLVLFMGPWSGGKSSTINYLLENEFSHTSLRTGAEPSPAYFNILMYGEEEEVLDGTQLAADWTFSGLQKFGQTLLDRLKGVKLPNKLLEKVNIVEIPGILEIRKQVQRLFPFNDACQWFIDRADIIFLVYDPSKLDVGPETEAILDQLKGREYQTRIILNKADQVKPEELMRVQGTLIWNISPLMSSSEPPIMYSTSLWSMPYEAGAPTRLLLAQERAFLRDLRDAIDKRVEHKISSARRFAVRVRNHAKMVDCYLTTYYNHKSFFGNRKKISDDIIENPQKYHIYEGLSTLTNISRYDLPDPDVYRDFFRINPLYDFKKLSETCTYFRGCPINKLDVAIAYDLPELVGKYRKSVEAAKEQLQKEES